MSATLTEARPKPRRARTDRSQSDCLVAGRGVRRSLLAAVRAGRPAWVIAKQADVQTRTVKQVLDGDATFLTEALANRLAQVTTRWERVLVPRVRHGYVPTSLVAPLLRASIERHGVEGTALRCGLDPRRVQATLNEADTLRIETADQIVCALHPQGPLAWQAHPYRRWYWMSVASL